MERKDCDERIPITEWPMCSDPEDSEYVQNQATAVCGNSSEYECRESCAQDIKSQYGVKVGTLQVEKLQSSLKRKQDVKCQDIPLKHHRDSDKGTDGYMEPMAAVRIAKWWRKQQHLHTNLVVSSDNPNTKLYHISRTKECHAFLKGERHKLKMKLSGYSEIDRASTYAALASIEDWLDLPKSALENINTAVDLCASNPSFLWLKAKLSRQDKTIQIQNDMIKNCSHGLPLVFPSVEIVDRISCTNLSEQDFKERFVKKGKPVILEDVVSSMTKETWDLDYIKKKAGWVTVPVKKNVPGSVEWARLEETRRTTILDHINEIQRGKTTDYLFDLSLPLHCPQLASELVLPKYFLDNYLTKTDPESLYHDSWPSLFVAPAGITSDLHVDAFASSFWMALFHGEKRWTFFDASDLALLYPKYLQSLDPVFSVNIAEPDLKLFPLLALTKPKQCTLKPGELLFVPSGSPHFVENLTASVAVSSNYVDSTNYHQVCEELKISGLLDPRAKQLLEQLESSEFKGRIAHKNN